ncbi:hypothetical protein [Aquiflexum gelatinilyticum]|uniref:hypothetical protein n=1 Tax=Aquiflexum gelatinilyticum TaxID=2961943 RepID=UPI0021679DCA|nr:hypothetical protein [Aquiflexum gelatinilyticum]MCS4432836.1 hypothetical protein [Aquiflexum gelatinilyticum]
MEETNGIFYELEQFIKSPNLKKHLLRTKGNSEGWESLFSSRETFNKIYIGELIDCLIRTGKIRMIRKLAGEEYSTSKILNEINTYSDSLLVQLEAAEKTKVSKGFVIDKTDFLKYQFNGELNDASILLKSKEEFFEMLKFKLNTHFKTEDALRNIFLDIAARSSRYKALDNFEDLYDVSKNGCSEDLIRDFYNYLEKEEMILSDYDSFRDLLTCKIPISNVVFRKPSVLGNLIRLLFMYSFMKTSHETPWSLYRPYVTFKQTKSKDPINDISKNYQKYQWEKFKDKFLASYSQHTKFFKSRPSY